MDLSNKYLGMGGVERTEIVFSFFFGPEGICMHMLWGCRGSTSNGGYISLSHSKYLPSHYTSWLIGFPAMGYDMLSQSPVN